MLPLRDLLRELELTVVAGEAGLDRPVRWVHISELEDPTPWLSGGELLLTTGLPLGDGAQQRAYLERLVEHELAGLGFGAGFSHEHVPDALRDAAAERGTPARRGCRRRRTPPSRTTCASGSARARGAATCRPRTGSRRGRSRCPWRAGRRRGGATARCRRRGCWPPRTPGR